MNKYSFIGKMATRKILLMQLALAAILILILLLAAPANAMTINQAQQRMDKAHQLAELGRYFGDSTIIAKGQVLYSEAAAAKKAAKAASRSEAREYLGVYRCTHYCSACDGSGTTASGKQPRVGVTVAADPKVLPLGSRVYIEGYGERTVQDTGGAIKGQRLDIYSERGTCNQLGVKKLKVWRVK